VYRVVTQTTPTYLWTFNGWHSQPANAQPDWNLPTVPWMEHFPLSFLSAHFASIARTFRSADLSKNGLQYSNLQTKLTDKWVTWKSTQVSTKLCIKQLPLLETMEHKTGQKTMFTLTVVQKNNDCLPFNWFQKICTHPTRTDDVNSSVQSQKRQPTSCKTKYASPAHL